MSNASSGQRVAVLSDVHGNAVALEAVLTELTSLRPDLVVFGGDLTWGPLPEETLALVNDIPFPTLFVRGNAERTLLEPSTDPTDRERWLLQSIRPRRSRFSRASPRACPSRSRASGP